MIAQLPFPDSSRFGVTNTLRDSGRVFRAAKHTDILLDPAASHPGEAETRRGETDGSRFREPE